MKLLLLCLCVGAALAAQCNHKGRTRSNGETWTDGSFKMKCTAGAGGWRVSIAACLTEQGNEIPVGGSKVEGGKKYQCNDQGGGRVGMSWQSI